MADIFLDFPINTPVERVFQAVSTPKGLDCWWTKYSEGKPVLGTEYKLWFGPEYDWRAKVTKCTKDTEFEFKIMGANDDWVGTHIGFRLESRNGVTWVSFWHTGWPNANEHYRISCNCWAMYLRILRRHLEHGESVPYESRLDA